MLRGNSLLAVAFLIALATFAFGADKLPPPNEPERAAAEALLSEVFGSEIESARDPVQKAAIAQRLLKLAGESKDDPSNHFVLLVRASELACSGGDIESAMQAVGELHARFSTDGLQQRSDALRKLTDAVRSEEGHHLIAELALTVSAACASEDRYTLALEVLETGFAAAEKSRDSGLVKKSAALREEVAAIESEYRSVARARSTLKDENPEDPKANEVVGRFLCIRKDDWKGGLPHCAKSEDPALSGAATEDLKNPSEAIQRLAVGDLWWDISSTRLETEKARYRSRAAHWYSQALPHVSGLGKAKAEKRIAEVSLQAQIQSNAEATDEPINVSLTKVRRIVLSQFSSEAINRAVDPKLAGGYAFSLPEAGNEIGNGWIASQTNPGLVNVTCSAPHAISFQISLAGGKLVSNWRAQLSRLVREISAENDELALLSRERVIIDTRLNEARSLRERARSRNDQLGVNRFEEEIATKTKRLQKIPADESLHKRRILELESRLKSLRSVPKFQITIRLIRDKAQTVVYELGT